MVNMMPTQLRYLRMHTSAGLDINSTHSYVPYYTKFSGEKFWQILLYK